MTKTTDNRDSYRKLFRFLKENDVFIRWEEERMKYIEQCSKYRLQSIFETSCSLEPHIILDGYSFGFSNTNEGYLFWENLLDDIRDFDRGLKLQ